MRRSGGRSEFEKTRVLRLRASFEGRLGSSEAGATRTTSSEIAGLRDRHLAPSCDFAKSSSGDRAHRRRASVVMARLMGGARGETSSERYRDWFGYH